MQENLEQYCTFENLMDVNSSSAIEKKIDRVSYTCILTEESEIASFSIKINLDVYPWLVVGSCLWPRVLEAEFHLSVNKNTYM